MVNFNQKLIDGQRATGMDWDPGAARDEDAPPPREIPGPSSPEGIIESLDDIDALLADEVVSEQDRLLANTMVEDTYRDPQDVDVQMITGNAGTGKCLGLGTPVMLATGRVVPVEKIKTGDELMGPDGLPRKVLSTNKGHGPLYLITPAKGDPWVCNDAHILTLRSNNNKRPRVLDVPLLEAITPGKGRGHGRPDKLWKLFRVPITFAGQDVLIDPYVAGMWLGDGNFDAPVWSLGEKKQALVEYLENAAPRHGCVARMKWDAKNQYTQVRYCQPGKHRSLDSFWNVLRTEFRRGRSRHIPDCYLYNTREVRMELLAGILDTDGAESCGGVDLINKSESLSNQILFLARSLGLAAYASVKSVKLVGWKEPRYYQRISISGNLSRLPLRRLKIEGRRQVKDVLNVGWDAEPIGNGDYYGFTLSGDGRFLLGDFTVTHNTYMVREMAKKDKGMKLCATTGIAAVNLDTITLNSLLKFFNTASLVQNYTTGLLTRRLRELWMDKGLRVLAIDEISMMPAAQLEVIYMALQAVNQRLAEPIRLILTGDFAQLPPVSTVEEPADWCFTAPCWGVIGKNVVRLEKVWRQTDPKFLAGLNLARAGKGPEAARQFREAGVKYTGMIDEQFPGTTIFAINRRVDEFNQKRLAQLDKPEVRLDNKFGGIPKTEWKNLVSGCPGGKIGPLVVKEGALVMILANDTEGGADGDMAYGNGDLGVVAGMRGAGVVVRLQRTGETVNIGRIRRWHECEKDSPGAKWEEEMRGVDGARGGWACGWMDWYPLRLGWATSVYKSQGLSMDNVQVDCRDRFFGTPNMAYVALSRARTPQGLRVVGGEFILARQIKAAQEVREWL